MGDTNLVLGEGEYELAVDVISHNNILAGAHGLSPPREAFSSLTSTMNNHLDDPFLSHLIALLSTYELCPMSTPPPQYDGPGNWQTDSILHSISAIAYRMYIAEGSLVSVMASESRSRVGENLEPSSSQTIPIIPSSSQPSTMTAMHVSTPGSRLFPSRSNTRVDNADGSVDVETIAVDAAIGVADVYYAPSIRSRVRNMSLSLDNIPKCMSCPTCGKVITDSITMARINSGPNGPLTDAGFESGVSAAEELRLFKIQVQDVARVCNAVARGDLSQKITAPVQDIVMVQLKGIINTMVDKLYHFAKEVTRVGREVGTEGKLGGQALVLDAEGIWYELTGAVNKLAASLTSQVRSITIVAKAISLGDLSRQIDLNAHGEILDLKNTVNRMVIRLRVLATEVIRVTLEVSQGNFDSQAHVPDVEGIWFELVRNVNRTCSSWTDQVRSISEVTKAVALGDLSKVSSVDVQGEMLDLKAMVNSMVAQLAIFAREVTKVAFEVGTEGKLGMQADVDDFQGIWQEIIVSVNTMARNLTTQLRGFARITAAVVDGDLNRFTPTRASGEMGSLESQINEMVFRLWVSFRDYVSARDAAELANRSKSEFLVNMSSEIRALMEGIISLTEMAPDSDPNKSHRDCLLLLHSLARSLLRVVDDVLDISKIETGRRMIQAVPYSIRQTVFGILKTLVVRASQSNLDLTYNVDTDIPDQLIGDPLRLRQIIVNIVGNAINFTPSERSRKGQVALSMRLLTSDDQSVTLEFCVMDTGIGIAEDKLDLTSYHADASTTHRHCGTSLGLEVSKRLVNLMHGMMWVESEILKGSKFFFTITSQLSQSPMEYALQKMRPFQGCAIMFVDTLGDTTSVVQRIQELGLEVSIIHHTSEIADKERCPHLDTLIVDSLTVTESIREYEHLRYLPIVLLTTSIPRLNLKWCLDNCISSQVTTPVTTQSLALALISALELNTAPEAAALDDIVFDILLAQNDTINQKLGLKILENYGHSVEIAEDGHSAVDAFKTRVQESKPFDIIFMEVSLPVMGGMEAAELIRTYEIHNNLSRTPIIALTAFPIDDQIRERCLLVGMDDCITKPLRRRDLLDPIKKLAGERVRHHLLHFPPPLVI